MNRVNVKSILLPLLAAILAGCATPRPVLDLASRGAGAVTLAEAEMQRYLSAAQDNLAARLVIVRQLSAAEIAENSDDEFSNFLKSETGQTSGDGVVNVIRKVGQERRRFREEMLADLAKLDDLHVKALGDEVHLPSEAIAAARKAFAALAQELSPQEWLALTTTYAKTIRDAVKKVREDASAKSAEPVATK